MDRNRGVKVASALLHFRKSVWKGRQNGRMYVRGNRGSKGGVGVSRPQLNRKPQWNYDQNTLHVLLQDRQKGHGFTASLFYYYYYCGFTYAHIYKRKRNFTVTSLFVTGFVSPE